MPHEVARLSCTVQYSTAVLSVPGTHLGSLRIRFHDAKIPLSSWLHRFFVEFFVEISLRCWFLHAQIVTAQQGAQCSLGQSQTIRETNPVHSHGRVASSVITRITHSPRKLRTSAAHPVPRRAWKRMHRSGARSAAGGRGCCAWKSPGVPSLLRGGRNPL
eukprot:COSAG03_NODE_6165_length_1103_cov_31.076693_2_plen_160_part_00